MIYDVVMPPGTDLVNSVQPNPVPGADGCWYFTVFASVNGAPAVSYMMRWSLDMPIAEFVPLETHTNAQGTPAVGMAGAGLWLWSFQGKKLRVQSVPDWAPPAWMRAGEGDDSGLERVVALLTARVAALEELVAQIGALMRLES